MAFSNFTCIFPIMTSSTRKNKITHNILILSGLASFIYHLFQKDKYGMPGLDIYGFKYTIKTSEYLLLMDNIT